MQLSYVLYFDIKGHFCVTSAMLSPAYFTFSCLLFINCRSYAHLGILFGFGLACFSENGDSTASLVRI